MTSSYFDEAPSFNNNEVFSGKIIRAGWSASFDKLINNEHIKISIGDGERTVSRQLVVNSAEAFKKSQARAMVKELDTVLGAGIVAFVKEGGQFDGNDKLLSDKLIGERISCVVGVFLDDAGVSHPYIKSFIKKPVPTLIGTSAKPTTSSFDEDVL